MSTFAISNGVWTLDLTGSGQVVSLRNGSITLRPAAGGTICEIIQGAGSKTVPVKSAALLTRTESSAEFESPVDLGRSVALRFSYHLSPPDSCGSAVVCRVQLSCRHPINEDVRLRWLFGMKPPEKLSSLFAPLFDGRGFRTSRLRGHTWRYLCAGGAEGRERLALPALDEQVAGSSLHITRFADPFFSTGLALPPGPDPDVFECLFLAAAGPFQFPERTFGLYVHEGDEENSLDGFFRYGIPGCEPGPDWLREIAMVHYDYLSEKGEGWFRDIDRLADLVSPADRNRIALTLHGWYDLLGRYSYDEAARKLDPHWTVMPQGNRADMSPGEIHRRIAHGKDRGFRVLLYYADGLAIDSGSPGYDEEIVFREPDGSLRKHHWAGPDTIRQTYVMNPVHPRVRSFFRGYTRALLEEFGAEIDGLTWDETFTTRLGDLSTGKVVGYADRAFMLLCAELRALIKSRFPSLAFLASDCTGLRLPQEDGSLWSANPAQNAVVFDGTFQDSQCYPTAWQYGLFPNYRNVLWSCNWQPLKNFEWTDLGVRAFGAPVAISNGWGENKGISRYSGQETEQLMQLFEFRKKMRGRIRWIESREE